MGLFTNQIDLFCGKCDKESRIEWVSLFSKVLGRKKPRFCPWCGAEIKGEKESTESDYGKE